MGKVILDMSISLDGIVAIPDDYRLHDWYFNNEASSQAVNDELIQITGAIVMGRQTYDLGDKMNGFADNPYKVPHFVLSHSVPEKSAQGTTNFIFVNSNLKDVLKQAKDAAGDKYVTVSGGVNIAQQFLKADLLDEIQLHLVPVLLGKGLSLFEKLAIKPLELEQIKVVESSGVTHLRWRFVK